MVDMFLHGGFIELIQSLTGIDVESNPVVEGEDLDRVVAAMSSWQSGPTFANDCRLYGITEENAKKSIEDLRECASRQEKVFL